MSGEICPKIEFTQESKISKIIVYLYTRKSTPKNKKGVFKSKLSDLKHHGCHHKILLE